MVVSSFKVWGKIVVSPSVLPPDQIDTDDSIDFARFTSADVKSAINKIRNSAL